MNIKSKIESLLFISAKPMSTVKLAALIKKEVPDIKKACDELVEDYKKSKNGIQIIKNATKYQMVSSPENTKLIQDFINDETTGDLSRPSLETLTIIAYRGPVAKMDLDRIRGVNCSLILRNLLLRGLVEVRHDKSKDEDYYSVTFDFIRFLGINDVVELPDYEKLSKDDTIERMLEDSSEAESMGERSELNNIENEQQEPGELLDKNSDEISGNQEEDEEVEIIENNEDGDDGEEESEEEFKEGDEEDEEFEEDEDGDEEGGEFEEEDEDDAEDDENDNKKIKIDVKINN